MRYFVGIHEAARGCVTEASIQYKQDGCDEDRAKGAYAAVCVCRTDYCNGSTTLAPPGVVLLVLTALVTFWRGVQE